MKPGASDAQTMCADCIGYAACFFHQLPGASRAVILPWLKERPFAAGEVLLRQGQPADQLQVVKVGDVVCMRAAPGGQEHAVAVAGRGQLLGVGGVWAGANPMTCQSLTAGRVCVVSVQSLAQAQLLDASFLQLLGQASLRAVNHLADWAMVSRLKTVDERVAGVLCMLTRVQHSARVRLPAHTVLASIASSSREAVVRALKQLEEEGRIVRTGRGIYEVHQHLCRFCAVPTASQRVGNVA